MKTDLEMREDDGLEHSNLFTAFPCDSDFPEESEQTLSERGIVGN